MYLSRHDAGPRRRWAANGRWLPAGATLDVLLELPSQVLAELATSEAAAPPLAPIEEHQEVWAAGVTYLRSREAREQESRDAGGSDIYTRVYDAERPELFFKAPGWRVAGPGGAIRARRDASWTVPEPELVVVCNRRLEITGYCAGNDVSSRDIEGGNPLYLPQAKIYDGACALGPGIVTCDSETTRSLAVKLLIERNGETVFSGETNSSEMKRSPAELVDFLGRELTFPHGVFLMTGTSIVPGDDYDLRPGDSVTVTVGELELTNTVAD